MKIKILTILILLSSFCFGQDGMMMGILSDNPILSGNSLSDSIIFFYALDESSGTTVTDASTNGNDGAANTSGVLGNTGVMDTYAATMDASGENIKSNANASALISDVTNLTISAWINVASYPNSSNFILAIPRSGTGSTGIGLLLNSTGRLTGYTYNTGVATTFSDGVTTLSTSTTYMVSLVKEGTLFSLYLNDGLVYSNNYNYDQPIGDYPIIIGNNAFNGSFLGGSINWVVLSDRAWSASEIATAYSGGSGLPFSSYTAQSQSQSLPYLVSADYYVSSTATGTDNGLTSLTPWTLSQLNAATLTAGDTIEILDDIDGQINISNSGTAGNPIVIASNNKSKIYGSSVLTGWATYSGNIDSAYVGKNLNITQLLVDGIRIRNARYPNSGYFPITTFTSSSVIQSDSLNTGIDYSGAFFLSRTGTWTLDTSSVASSTTSTLTLNTALASMEAGDGIVLMNKLDFLDQAGEWVYDKTAGTIYLWTSDNTAASTHTVRYSDTDYGVNMTSQSYVNIENLEFRDQRQSGVYANSCSNLTVKDCNFIYSEMRGVNINSGTTYHNTVDGNYIRGCNDRSIYIQGSSNAIVQNNIVENTMLFDSLGVGGDGNGTSIFVLGDSATIQYNEISNGGYNGIEFRGIDSHIQNNFIKGVMLTLDDGGGIYTYNSDYALPGSAGSIIQYNIIDSVPGQLAGFTSTYAQGVGIYTDGQVHDVDVLHNTIYRVGYVGCFQSGNNSGINVSYNTIMDFWYGQFQKNDNGINTWMNNIVYAKATSMTGTGTEKIYRTVGVTNYPNTDNNSFFNHYTSTNQFNDDGTYYDLTGWQTASGKDANSTMDVSTFTTETDTIIYNSTSSTIFKSLIGTYEDIDGNTVTFPVSLSPGESMILIKQ